MAEGVREARVRRLVILEMSLSWLSSGTPGHVDAIIFK